MTILFDARPANEQQKDIFFGYSPRLDMEIFMDCPNFVGHQR
jgi:hypothetical protein